MQGRFRSVAEDVRRSLRLSRFTQEEHRTQAAAQASEES